MGTKKKDREPKLITVLVIPVGKPGEIRKINNTLEDM